MVIEDSREYKAAQELERALNDYSWNPKRFAESTRYYHRTLQQELMRTIVAIIQMVGDESYGTYYIDALHTKLSFDNGVAQQQDISHRYKWKQCHCNEEYQSRQ